MMTNVETLAQNLSELDEENLTVQLGVLSQYVESNPGAESLITSLLDEENLDAIPTPRGAFDDLFQAGMQVFNSVSPTAYKICCSPVEGVLIKDPDLAKELTKLMDEKTAEATAKATAILAPILSSSGLGLPQSLAVVLGALLVKKLAKGTSDFICINWLKTTEANQESGQDVTPIELDSESQPLKTENT